MPISGRLTRGVNTARFTRTLSILSGSGVPFIGFIRQRSYNAENDDSGKTEAHQKEDRLQTVGNEPAGRWVRNVFSHHRPQEYGTKKPAGC